MQEPHGMSVDMPLLMTAGSNFCRWALSNCSLAALAIDIKNIIVALPILSLQFL